MRKLAGYLAVAIAVCFLVVGFFGVSYAVVPDKGPTTPSLVVAKFFGYLASGKHKKARELLSPAAQKFMDRAPRKGLIVEGKSFLMARGVMKRGNIAGVIFWLDLSVFARAGFNVKIICGFFKCVGGGRIQRSAILKKTNGQWKIMMIY